MVGIIFSYVQQQEINDFVVNVLQACEEVLLQSQQ